MKYHDPEDETVARYVAHSLKEAESSAFEQHLLVCEQCRNEVRLAELIRSELPRTRRTIAPWIAGAGLALAASLAIVVLRSGHNPLVELGAVTSPPAYDGVPVRSTTNATDSLFAVAMTLYKSGAYGESAKSFAAARAAGADLVTTTFFLGASQLMTGRSADAVNELGRAARTGSTLYTAESHYYRAKALLQLGKKDEALRELTAATAFEGPIQSRASLLADSIKAAR